MKKILFNNNKNVVSENIRKYRKLNGLNQNELAARLQTMGVNIDQQMVSKIEKNTRFVTDYELACICKVLKVEIKDMLSDFYETYVKEP